ncbi:sensor domain-containing phosphodiesterase [Thermodesulfovibrio hydrogeniphilus]
MPESLKLKLCYHVKEANEIGFWEKIAKKISLIIEQPVEIEFLKGLSEEIFNENLASVYYTNPDDTISLINKNYIVLGKLKGSKESLCAIKSKNYNPDKEKIKVAIIKKRYFYLPLLFFGKDYKKFQIHPVSSYTEAISLLKQGEVDIAFVYTELGKIFYEENLDFSTDFCFSIPHYIVIHPSFVNFKEKLLSIEEFEPVHPDEIKHLNFLYIQLNNMLNEWSNHDIAQALILSPNIGVIVYQDKIVFANNYALKMLEYAEDEFYKLKSIDIVLPKYKGELQKVVERRLKGEKFQRIYEIEFLKKDSSTIWVNCLTDTILFRGLPSGLILFYDITKQKREQGFRELLQLINKVITTALTEEEIYDRVCKDIVEKLKFKCAIISQFKEESVEILENYYSGDCDSVINIVNEIIKLFKDKIVSSEIIVFSDFQNENLTFSSNLVKNGIHSGCIVSFTKNKKIASALFVFSENPDIFDKSSLEILKEIQHDISFALDRVEKIKEDLIIGEALRNSDTWILVTDENGKIIYVNEAVEKISGYKREELIGKNPRIFKSGLNPPEFYKEMWDTILSGKIFHSITPNRKKSGEIFHVDLKIIPVKLPGNITRFIAVAKDITEKMELSERLQHMQNYDALTGLLNLNGFIRAVTEKINTQTSLGAFCLIDIYDMTSINKLYGLSAGDLLLKEISQKIKELFKESTAIARLHADTFGIYVVCETSADIYQIYSKLNELNEQKYMIDDKMIPVNINASLVIYPKDGKSFKELYEKADITVTKAKRDGSGIVRFYSEEIEKNIESQWNTFTLVKNAIEKNLFKFYYQPYYSADSLNIEGFEALVRIVDEDGKLYTPNMFIDYLESSHYLEAFERWAINEVIEKITKWGKSISINISGKTLVNPAFTLRISTLPDKIREKLTIEITERILIKEPEHATVTLLDIKNIDFPPKIALDDFGTGYSSLNYLKDLPIDIIKIDRAFVKDLTTNSKNLAITQTIIYLAKKLGMKVLAEGIETEPQYNLVKELGCDFVQGFLFSKPLPEEEIDRIIKQN